MNNKLKILLTGGNGFIGKNIPEILGDKYDILAPGRAELNLFDFGAVQEYLRVHRPDLVIHAAAAGGNRKTNDQSGILQKNLTMFYNLCANKEFFNRMIVFGSGAEYDKRRELHLVKEEEFGQRIPADEYGLAKFTMAKLAESSGYITHLRFFGVFGKHEDYTTRFISNAICKKLFGLPLTIRKNVYFDYLYVNDAVKILDLFIENTPKEKFFNIGTGKPVDLLTLANIVNTSIGQEGQITISESGLNNEYSCNVGRMKKFLGNFQFTGIDKSIAELTEYYKNNLNNINKEDLLFD